jgi:hypothetical protein
MATPKVSPERVTAILQWHARMSKGNPPLCPKCNRHKYAFPANMWHKDGPQWRCCGVTYHGMPS